MKKRLTLIFALIMIIMSIGQSVCAINVIMNSSFVKFPDQEPVIENGTTLVPIRTIAEALELEVSWDDPTDTVRLTKDDFYIELVIGSKTAKTSSGTKTLLTAPKIINSRTMLPLRFIAEELGLTVLWNDKYQRVVINGQIDTEKLAVEAKEQATESEDEEASEPEGVKEDKKGKETAEEPTEEETEFVEEITLTTISAASSSISFEMPAFFLPEETDKEDSFAVRSIDAFDAEHTYDWNSVTVYESYVDDTSTSGICFIVQEFAPYEGEEHDVSIIFDEYPEAPQRPETDFGYIMSEVARLLIEQVCDELGVAVPKAYIEMTDDEKVAALGVGSVEELHAMMFTAAFNSQGLEIGENYEELSDDEKLGMLGLGSIEELEEIALESVCEELGVPVPKTYEEMSEEEQAAYLGFESVEDMNEYNRAAMENFDMMQIPEYVEYADWQMANSEYRSQVRAIDNARSYAIRKFSEVVKTFDDETWAEYFADYLNSDEEVRYEGVELIDHKGKKIVHATIYAEDPDDEQGVYDFYMYIDGDMRVTIFGGTLSGSEPLADAVDALSNMIIE